MNHNQTSQLTRKWRLERLGCIEALDGSSVVGRKHRETDDFERGVHMRMKEERERSFGRRVETGQMQHFQPLTVHYGS